MKFISKLADIILGDKVSKFFASGAILIALVFLGAILFLNEDVKAEESAEVVRVIDLSSQPVMPDPIEYVSEYKTVKYRDVYISAEIQEYVDKYIAKYGGVLEKELVYSLIYAESRFNPDACNTRTKCSGIMQLQPKYYTDDIEELGYDDIFDVEGNIEVGIRHLSNLYKEYDDIGMTLICYHRGEGGGTAYYNNHGDYDAYTYDIMTRYLEDVGQ